MEYVYAAMLLHSAGKEINEKNVKAVLKGAGVDSDDGRVKALIASLDGIDIEEAMSTAVAAPAAAPVAGGAGATEAVEEVPAEEEEEEEESGFEGLGSLFG
ncbi:MAG: 50S ribosomal protein P1 [Methanobacteriota archaeon]|nr:MAG: 50S ribosomal protein P1 [Euryarchaeota archaeon]|tara:strand:+ start:3387 stop:3689 length:303 start_codon:yes stop_codon:yes gene_type:complete